MRTDEVQVYETTDGWRWRYVNGSNGQVMADGSQGYADKRDAMHGAFQVTGATRRGVLGRRRVRLVVL